MKQKETLLNTTGIKINDSLEELGDDHVGSSHHTPMREGAFDMKDEEKIALIENHFREIMHVLGLDLTDDSLKGTPKRVAKMYINEVFSGLDPKNMPKVRLFENKYKYNEMLVEKDITLFSHCEHHFVPIFGKAHVAYISKGNVIGLSKINRIVQYFSHRPQVQERLTMQIGHALTEILETEDVAVIIDAHHMCVSSRGIKDVNSNTVTSFYGGKFEKEEQSRTEFLQYLSLGQNVK